MNSTCSACFEAKPDLESFGCVHSMCNDCLVQFIELSLLKQRKSFLLLKCPYPKCEAMCSFDMFKKYGTKACLDRCKELMKTVPEDPKKMEDFGYAYNEKGELRNIYNGEPFHFISQYHYDALGEFVVRYIQEKMIKDFELQEVWLPLNSKIPIPVPLNAKTMQTLVMNNIFMSKDALSNPEKLMLIIQGSGAVRAGMWARALCINDTLATGTIFNYLTQAKQEGYGVIVFNPNLNRVPQKLDPLAFTKTGFLTAEKPKPILPQQCTFIDQNASPPEHTVYVWDQFVTKSKAKHIVIVAHSAGGWCTMELLRNRGGEAYSRLRGIAFTDSVHSVLNKDPAHVKQFIIKNSVNWASSDEPLDTRLKVSNVSGCLCVSAGHPKHEHTSESCRTSAFKYLAGKIKEAELSQSNNK